MIQILAKRGILFIASLALLFSFVVAPASVYAAVDIDGSLEQGACVNDPSCNINDGKKTINQTIENIINIFSLIVGIVAVIMIIYGGFRYVTSGGDAGNISSAKNTILYAIVGLVIVAISQAIVQFVLAEV